MLQLSRLHNMKLHVFRSLGKQTYNFENEYIFYPKFAWYAEGSSSVDTSPKSYHLTDLELINLLVWINFSDFECKMFLIDLKSSLTSSVML